MPIFKGLSDRFAAQENQIYNKFDARQNGVGQPFIEIKPNDPNIGTLDHDTFEIPQGSFNQDFTRITDFLKSPDGVSFLLAQAELQTGNTFSETRIYDPLFPFGKVILNGNPVRRDLSTQLEEGVSSAPPTTLTGAAGSFVGGLLQGGSGLDSTTRSPASMKIGAAGRLQKETQTSIVNQVLGNTNPVGLLNLLPPGKLTRILSAIQSITDEGSLDTNQRPEFDVDGELYSVLLWEGFNRGVQTQTNQFFKAGQDVRNGNFGNIIPDLLHGVENAVTTTLFGSSGPPVPTSPVNGRDDPNNTSVDGLRYFITDEQNADMYLATNNLSFLKKNPFFLSGNPVDPTTSSTVSTNLVQSAIQQANKIQSSAQSFFGTVNGYVKTASSFLFGTPISLPFASNILALGSSLLNIVDPGAANSAEEAMLFTQLSLHNRYLNDSGNVGFIRDNLDKQQTQWLNSVSVLNQAPSFNAGYTTGLPVGVNVNDDAGVFSHKRTKVDSGQYYHDGALDRGATPIYNNQDTDPNVRTISTDLKTSIRSIQNDMIDFMFHDFVNNRVVPFRAIISDINESVAPEYDTQRYIGRTERNIIYMGAFRELNFSFYVQANAKQEMDYIWEKVNYLTGLCFPSQYSSGYMVPPFVQLTLGQYYVDQPGYIKSLTYIIDENTSWEIDSDVQMPMGIRVTLSFSVIEKKQVSTGFGFYGFGTPQQIDLNNAFIASQFGNL